MNEATNLADIFNIIIDDISNGKCVLFLGPELLVNRDGAYYKSHFKEIEHQQKGVYKYFSRDNLFSINSQKEDVYRRLLIQRLSAFYQNAGDEIILDLISRIPFALIINTAPDVGINNVFKKNGYPFQPAFFRDPRDQSIGIPTKENPVIYNIFGRIDESQSLIVTHDDLFRAVKGLMQQGNIPLSIQSFLQSAGSFIFLGMKFETWYYQLLLSILGIKESNALRIGAPDEADSDTVSVVSSYFRIEFANNNPLKVIQELHDLLKVIPGSLRQPPQEAPKVRVVSYISYAWNDEVDANREAFVDLVYKRLTEEHGVKIVRDRNTLTVGDSIESFMNRIGRGKAVIMVVSDKYLKSEYCMYEAWQVYKNDHFRDRVFIAALPDIDKRPGHYTQYWKARKDGLAATVTGKITEDIVAVNGLMTSYKNWSYIHLFVDEFLKIISDSIHYQVPPNFPGGPLPTPAATDPPPAAPEPGSAAQFENFIAQIVNKLAAL